MAHDGSGTLWDETAPADTDRRAQGAQEIRDLRRGLRLRVQKEHEALATTTGGGEHLPGSAKVYVDATDPTLRPDGTTALDTDDEGRLWIEGNSLRSYSGSAFLPTSGIMASGNLTGVPSAADGSWSGYATFDLVPRVLILDGPNGVNISARAPNSDGQQYYTASKISGTSVVTCAYEVDFDITNKRFRMRPHQTVETANIQGGTFRYAAYAIE